MNETQLPRQIRRYQTLDGKEPYSAWFWSLRDPKARAVVLRRMERVKQGNLGDWKRFGPIIELRIDLGPGYRVYLGQEGGTWLILLAGGDKSSQQRDFKRAVRYWHDYKARGKAALGPL